MLYKVKSHLAAKKIITVLFILLSINGIAQVKIGSPGSPNANAVLELDGGTSKGLLLPKLTNTQITALNTAPDGLMIYNTTDGFIYVRKAAVWQKITDATNNGGFTLPYSGGVATAAGLYGFRIQNTNAGNAIQGEAFGAGYGVYGYSANDAGGYFTSPGGYALVTGLGNVGIGTVPTLKLDVDGRVRLRSNVGNTAGIWYDKVAGDANSSFVGTLNDSIFGIYNATGGGWKFFFNHINNNFGIYNADPRTPLSFATTLGKKISLYRGTSGDAGFGVFGNELRLHSDYSGAVTTVGYDDFTNGFTETFRFNTNGSTELRNPIILNAGVENATYFKTSNKYTGAIKTIGAGTATARMGFFTWASDASSGLREHMSISDDGNVFLGLNITDFGKGAGYKLRVQGKIIAEELRVTLVGSWPDYVFDDAYKLPTLENLEKYIQTNKHLPNVPAAAEVEKSGIAVGEMQTKMMEKIEELTLYILQLKKENTEMKVSIEVLKKNKKNIKK